MMLMMSHSPVLQSLSFSAFQDKIQSDASAEAGPERAAIFVMSSKLQMILNIHLKT